jgi:uncharacterized protein
MKGKEMDLRDLEQMTAEYGEGWALPHVHRLLKLIGRIDAGLTYDKEALTYAVYLHDWGAFSRFCRSGIDHAQRSRQIAESEVLPQTSLNATQKEIILDSIEFHDYRCVLPVWTQEAVLLREADFLDFLGAIGVAREFSWQPNQLRKAYDRLFTRRDEICHRFTIPAAQQIAAERVERMNAILEWIREDSMGEL